MNLRPHPVCAGSNPTLRQTTRQPLVQREHDCHPLHPQGRRTSTGLGSRPGTGKKDRTRTALGGGSEVGVVHPDVSWFLHDGAERPFTFAFRLSSSDGPGLGVHPSWQVKSSLGRSQKTSPTGPTPVQPEALQVLPTTAGFRRFRCFRPDVASRAAVRPVRPRVPSGGREALWSWTVTTPTSGSRCGGRVQRRAARHIDLGCGVQRSY